MDFEHINPLITKYFSPSQTIKDIIDTTTSKYNLDFDGKNFLLVSKLTACLALDACGIPAEKPRIKISDLQNNACSPGSGCC